MPLDPKAAIQPLADIEAIPTILEVVCRTTGMGFAAVARVTDDQWIACAVQDDIGFGLQPGGELTLETTLCNEIRQHHQPIVIDEVATDTQYALHHTPKTYGLQSYISYPVILSDGTFFGTLCAIDPKPNKLNTPGITGMFKLFADLIAFHLDARRRVDSTEGDLKSERETAGFREQFIAVLGHDLRNPLASLGAGLGYLERHASGEKVMPVVAQMKTSISRMARMIDDIMDFARGRLGGGIAVTTIADVETKPIIEQVIAELRVSHPGRAVRWEAADAKIPCDPSRFGQLLSNLVFNALTHGDPTGEVRVHSSRQDGRFKLSVANAGTPIPPEKIATLFEPFHRAPGSDSHSGLGLGLYIAAQIAKAHGGTLSAKSDQAETRFTFTLPVQD